MRVLTGRTLGAIVLAAAAGQLLLGCSSESESVVDSAILEDGVAARVGGMDLSARMIRQVAEAQDISLEAARERAVRDALFGLAAEQRPMSANIRAAVRARLARATLENIADEVTKTEPTDAEVEAATEGHYLELDRPEGFRVIHVVARTAADADDSTKLRARRVAEKIAKAVAGAADAKDFETRARGVETDGVEIRVESLDPVAADGRLLRPEGGELVKPFAAAAARLASPGDQSPVTETDFGYHIMMLLERTAAKKRPLAERRTILRQEILANRAREATSKALEALRSEKVIHVERSAAALMQSLQVLTP